MLRHVFATVLGLLITHTALAQDIELPGPKSMSLRGGMMCNSLDGILAFLDLIGPDGLLTKDAPDECVMMVAGPEVVRFYGGIPALVTPVVFAENDYATHIVISKFDFTVHPMGIQYGVRYGWIAFKKREPKLEL